MNLTKVLDIGNGTGPVARGGNADLAAPGGSSPKVPPAEEEAKGGNGRPSESRKIAHEKPLAPPHGQGGEGFPRQQRTPHGTHGRSWTTLEVARVKHSQPPTTPSKRPTHLQSRGNTNQQPKQKGRSGRRRGGTIRPIITDTLPAGGGGSPRLNSGRSVRQRICTNRRPTLSVLLGAP